MKRVVVTYGKNGVIKISGNHQESILYLRNKPIQYSWLAEIGSTWRYHIAQGLKKQSIQINSEIERILKAGIDIEGEFLGITEYFLQFLTYGIYEFGYFELFEDISWVDIPKEEIYESFDYYGGSLSISPTQNELNETLVDEYKEIILRGAKPAMVIIHVENSHMFYILDGHHKFKAYKKANKSPFAIVITKLGNEFKTETEGIKLAKSMNCTDKNYLKRLKDEKQNLDFYKNNKMNIDQIFRRINLDKNNV